MTGVRPLLAVGGAMIMLAIASPAGAAPAWNPTITLNEPQVEANFPQVAVDAHGNAVAVWLQLGNGVYTVMSADHPAGGGWGPAVAIAPGTAHTAEPVLAVDAAGDAFAAWAQDAGGTHAQIYASSRPRGGAWQTTPDVFGDASSISISPHLSVDSGGDEVLAWITETSAPVTASAWATYRPAGGAWLSAQQQSSSAGQPLASGIATAIDPRGAATVAWGSRDASSAGSHYALQVSRHVPGAFFPWGFAPTTVSANASHDAGTPALATDADGDVTAIWVDSDGATTPTDQVLGADLSAGSGPWSAPAALSSTAELIFSPSVAFTPDGRAIATWASDASSGVEHVQSAVRPAGGAWSHSGADVSPAITDAYGPVLSVGSGGAAALGWTEQTASLGPYSPMASVLGSGSSSWSAPHAAGAGAENGRDPAVAVDGTGAAIFLWDSAGNSNRQVRAASFSAPAITAASLPTTGIVGAPVSFSVSPFDVWSPVTTTWTFGDGTQATGTSPSHVYGAAGTYAVTASASNLGGSTATTGSSITITPGAPGSGSGSGHGDGGPGAGAPVLSRVSQSHREWARAGRAATIAAAGRQLAIGTTFAVTLSADATLRFAFARTAAGRMRGHRCVPAGRRRSHHRQTCRLARPRGTLALAAHKGADRVAFYGQLSRRRQLSPGPYAVRITAADAGGVSPPATLNFTIAR